jgi:predicted PurR-regulated permease PerM
VWLVSNADDRRLARKTLIVIGLVLATLIGLAFVWAIRHVVSWIVVAAFFAVALDPLVNWVQGRLVRRRATATLLVFLAAFMVVCGLGALIVVPLLNDLTRFAARAPDLLSQAKAGRGPLGQLLQRFHVLQYVQNHASQLESYATRLGRPTIGVIRQAAQDVAGALAIVVLAYLMVVAAPRINGRVLAMAGDAHAERLRRIGRASSRTVTGYLTGNLLISVIIGAGTFVILLVTGVPFASVIALVVAIADLIPLVGASLGGMVAVAAGLVHSLTTGVIVLVFYVVYQQLEVHLLHPLILTRTVRLSPLTVLVSLLIGTELFGLLGTLLAIPAAGLVEVLLREYVPALRRAELDGAPANPERPAEGGGPGNNG